MLPIINGSTRSYVAVKTDGGKKKIAMSYSFQLDTGEAARKAGRAIQDATEKGYDAAARYVRRKYRTMKFKKALNDVRKGLMRKVDFEALKSRVREIVHA